MGSKEDDVPVVPVVTAMTNRQSQQMGFLRWAMMVAGVLNAVSPWQQEEGWRPIKVLVDTAVLGVYRMCVSDAFAGTLVIGGSTG